MHPGYSERSETDDFGTVTTWYHESFTDESALYIDHTKSINTKYSIPETVKYIKVLIKIKNEPEILCVAKRHTFYAREETFHREMVYVWQIYDADFTYPKTMVNKVDDIKPKYVLDVIGQYQTKEDAELNFKENAVVFFRQRTGLNQRFLSQISVRDAQTKSLTFINDRLFEFLSITDLKMLRMVCRVPVPKDAGFLKKLSSYDTRAAKLEDEARNKRAVELYKRKDYFLALELFHGLLDKYRKRIPGLLGTEQTATLEYNIGSIFMNQNKAPEALTYLRSSYNTRDFELGADDEKTKKVEAKLDDCKNKLSAMQLKPS